MQIYTKKYIIYSYNLIYVCTINMCSCLFGLMIPSSLKMLGSPDHSPAETPRRPGLFTYEAIPSGKLT